MISLPESTTLATIAALFVAALIVFLVALERSFFMPDICIIN